jgi:hypothetical protein
MAKVLTMLSHTRHSHPFRVSIEKICRCGHSTARDIPSKQYLDTRQLDATVVVDGLTLPKGEKTSK